MPRRACRKDKNHDAICKVLVNLGVLLFQTYQHAQYTAGFPDVIGLYYGQVGVIEIKGEGKGLTPDEDFSRMQCDAMCPGLYVIMRTEEDAEAWVERCEEARCAR